MTKFPDYVNPVTKEKGGPRGTEPTQYAIGNVKDAVLILKPHIINFMTGFMTTIKYRDKIWWRESIYGLYIHQRLKKKKKPEDYQKLM